MIIYMAARYGRREEILNAAQLIEDAIPELHVRSSWLDGTHKDSTPSARASYAALDLWEVAQADCLITFTEEPDDNPPGRARGGRWVEVGYALGLEKKVICVGPRENIFLELPGVVKYNTIEECIEYWGDE